jgi:hypothetical protein
MCTKLIGAVMAALVVCGCGSSDGDSNSCAAFCGRAYADCKRDITQAECEAACNNPQHFPGCTAQATELVNCWKQATSFVCTGFGPQPVSCDTPSMALADCVFGQQGDGGLSAHDARDDTPSHTR